ncbi:MAG: ABC transporter ATP-binding protein [Actinomycetota bacterium]
MSALNPPAAAVHLARVSKAFNDKPALTDLTVVAPEGKITVLLGPNGAGKTTAIRCITGAMSPDQGVVRTLGLDPSVDGETVRSDCGVVSAKPALYDRLTGWDNLIYAAQLHGVEKTIMTDRIRAAAARFGIEHALDEQVGGYSTGMKTRLALSRSVLHEPRLLLFDEPTSGLDPESAQAVLQLIRDMTVDGHTVVMCTHHLVEAEGLADHIIVLDNGNDLVSGAPSTLTRAYWPEDSVLVAIEGDDDRLRDLTLLDGVRRVETDADSGGSRVVVDEPSVIPDVVDALTGAGARVTKIVPHEPSLEELYFAVRRTAREGRIAEVPPGMLPAAEQREVVR